MAKFFKVMVCADTFDFDLAWQMYNTACKYVQRLNLQNLDAGNPLYGEQGRISDNDRKGFWELIQTDLIFQLMFDKPPSITATSWKVNMPWLNLDSATGYCGMETTLFLTGSRIALILMRFFPMLKEGEGEDPEDLVHKTEALCREIKQLYDEGQLVSYKAMLT
jgi:hypothetical protein